MAAIDSYLKNVARLGAAGVGFTSGGRVALKFPDGDRLAQQIVSHLALTNLVDEIAPPAVRTSLRHMRRSEFPYAWERRNFMVRVEPGRDEWRVDVREERAGVAVAAGAMERPAVSARAVEGPPPIELPSRHADAAARHVERYLEPPTRHVEPPPRSVEPPPRHVEPPPRHVEPASDSAPRIIEQMLLQMQAAGASDLHLSTGTPPMMRLHGRICPLPGHGVLAADALLARLFEITPEKNQRQFEERNDTDFAHSMTGVSRFRANLFRDRHGPAAVFRAIPFRVPSAAELGLPPRVLELCQLQKGLVLVTGPTGSGKSTTLAALINHINETRSDHIITIEDPVEFVYESRQCLIHQREVGSHTCSFKDALRAALREDPDIVLVGEMRDLETVALAVETAETGHLVFGTLHTSSAPSTVDRIVDQFPADRQEQIRQMLSESLCGVIAQTLCSKIGGGRVAAYEVLLGSSAVSNLIRERKTFQLHSLMQTGRGQGMVTLNDSLIELVRKKLVEPREAWIKSLNKVEMKGLLQREGITLEEPKAATGG